MAKNLRAKIPSTDKLVICDRNQEATSSFVQEAQAGSSGAQEIEVVTTPRKVAEQAVSDTPYVVFAIIRLLDEHVLSMI